MTAHGVANRQLLSVAPHDICLVMSLQTVGPTHSSNNI